MEDTRRLTRRLEELEKRLQQLESFKVVLEEKKIAAGEKELEGKTYFQSENGGIVKEVRVPVCDTCGRRNDEFNVCVACGRKLCEKCCISFQSRVYCRDCLKEMLPLSKEEYKVLRAMASEVHELETIEVLTKIRKGLIKECKRNLEEKRLIERKGFLLFYKIKVLDKGLEAISAYRQVYGNEEDVVLFEEELRRTLDENL